MMEIRCQGCGKICAYLKAGSRIANGSIMFCQKCKASAGTQEHEIPDFLRGFGGKK